MVTWPRLRFLSKLVPTSTSLAWSLTTSSPSKTICVILFPRVSERIGTLRLMKRIFVDASVYFLAILNLFSQSLSIVLRCGAAAECHLQLLECQVYSVARLCHDQSLLSLYHRLCVAELSMLYKVNANSNHCLFNELSSDSTRVRHTELRPQLIHWNLKYQGEETPNLQGVSCWPRFECGITFPTLRLTPECWMGSRVQLTVGCFPELCFIQFSVAQVLVWLRKQFINNFVFPAGACAAGFNNKKNNRQGELSKAPAAIG